MVRGAKWMGDLAGSGGGTCFCGETAADTSSPVITIERARRTANPLPDSVSRILFTEPFNLALLAGSVFRTLRGDVRTKQVPANPRFIGQGVLGNL